MYKLWMQSRANIRSTKSVSVTLAVMFMVAAFLLNAGLLVTINYGNFFDTLKQELNPADAYFAIPDALYSEKLQNYIDENEHVLQSQTHEVLWFGPKIESKDEEKSYNIMFQNMDEAREMSKWKYIGDPLPAEEMSVYLPDVFKAVDGYELNDSITLRYPDAASGEEKSLTFTVRGYTEDIFFSSTDTGMMSFYLTGETYRQMEEILSDLSYRAHVVFTDLDEIKNASTVDSGIRDLLELSSASLLAGDISSMLVAIDLDLIEMSRCMMASMIALMMVVFSAVIIIVCLLVVRFRIVNSIEEDIMKIGSLKSIGYTGGQIRVSILLQFLLIAGIGSIAGIALSYPVIPAISMIFEQQSGLKWEQGFDAPISLAALAMILVIVAAAVLLAARKIGRLSPISALRGEISARKYKHNPLLLEKTGGTVSTTLAFKSILQSMKQNIMIVIILIAVTFAGSYGIIMYYNTSVDTKAFAEVPGMEITNVIAVLNPERASENAAREIGKMEQVRKTQYLDEVKVGLDGTEVTAYVMEDYAGKETRLVYDGRYPETSHEIVLAGVLADRMDKSVGDTVTLRFGENEEQFTVTGLSNGSSMGGLNTCILAEDFKSLNPAYVPQSLYIYLEDGIDSGTFIEQLKEQIDEEILLATTDFDKELAEGMAAYQNIVAAMGLAMLIITLLVVTLVLYFMISSSVLRHRRELGIQKAIGFTTPQLMLQISLIFAVPVVIGAVLGSLMGAFLTNPMMSVMMQGIGIMKANFIVDPLWVALFGIGTFLFSYLLSLLVTWRIRKISAYALVTE